MRSLRFIVALMLFLAAPPALAVQPDEILADPALEARARTLSQELRCMVCQNQSIDDSDAPLARDLRLLVRERLRAGDSDREVLGFLVQRYGEFVLLRPPFAWHTALLWLIAPLLLLAGGLSLVLLIRRHGTADSAVAAQLSPAEQRRVRQLLASEDPSSPLDSTRS